MKNAKEDRNNNMGTLHILAAAFVMYGHQCAILQHPIPTVLGTLVLALGVKTIFLISGYLITKSLWSNKNGRVKGSITFCLKRIGRIYPELIVCLVVTALVIGPLFSALSPQEYFADPLVSYNIRKNLLLFPVFALPGLFMSNPYPVAVNGSLWTIPVEMTMYAVLLLIYLCSKKETIRKIIYAIVTVIVVVAAITRFAVAPASFYVVYGTDWGQALNIIPYFMIGGLAYIYDIRKLLNVQVAAVLFFALSATTITSQAISESVSLLVLSYFVLSLMLAEKQELKLRVIRGEYAYGMYLWGFPIQQCIVQKMYVEAGLVMGPWIYFGISVVLTYFVAMISYHIVYVPVSLLLKKGIHLINSTKEKG